MEYRIIPPSSPEYPKKATDRLGNKAPTIYGHGNLGLLDRFTLSVLCSDQSHGTELRETNEILFVIREFNLNYLGSWHSVIETEIFRVSLFKGYSLKTKSSRSLRLGDKTLTLFSAKGLARESYESYLLDRFYPPLHQFPEREEYFRQAAAGELLMLSVSDPNCARQSRKNIMMRNWMICVLGDVLFIPYGPKGTKTYSVAKKAMEAGIPAFTIDNASSADLHVLGIPGFNRETIGVYLEEKGASRATENGNSDPHQEYTLSPESYKPMVKESSQKSLDFDNRAKQGNGTNKQ